ncbi:MAG TPA: glycosyltransferase, partial [Terriglobales bacterium]
EAMACGVPVVCSPETSLPEVAGDAAVYADPTNSIQFAAALGRVFSDAELRAQLIERGYANGRRFSWESAANRVLAVYQRSTGLLTEKAVCA